MGDSSGEESNGQGHENQSLLAIEGPKMYDFLALVELEESDNESCDTTEIKVKAKLDKSDSEIEDEDSYLILMAGRNPDNRENNQQETKVSFEQVKKNIHTYSKKKLKLLSQVLINAYLSISELKNIFEGVCIIKN